MLAPGVVVVTRPTRMQGLLQRWATRGQAQFVFKRNRVVEFSNKLSRAASSDLRAVEASLQEVEEDADEDFLSLESENDLYQQGLETLKRDLLLDVPLQFIDREYLPTFNFGNTTVVVVVGQDGLVANTAKYVGTLPIVAVNPDPARIDGVLLPFNVQEARGAVQRVLKGAARTRPVTLAQATLQDGQRLLAFNDLFIGAKSHVSARYQLSTTGGTEHQSSSGVLVSTGAGSTGWLSSVVNMASGLASFLGDTAPPPWKLALRWEDRQLVWAVREPFLSKGSQISQVAGRLRDAEQLVIESQMPADGVIFSDGVEQDFLQFNSGTIATIGIADHMAKLVVK